MVVPSRAEDVYSNRLIFPEILRLVSREDQLACLLSSQTGFDLAVKELYHTVDDDVLERLIREHVVLDRFLIYAKAVRVLRLSDPTFPSNIPTKSIRNLYPNVRRILFSLPIGIGHVATLKNPMSLSTLVLYDPTPPPINSSAFCVGRDDKQAGEAALSKNRASEGGTGKEQGSTGGRAEQGGAPAGLLKFDFGNRNSTGSAAPTPFAYPSSNIIGELHLVCDKRPVWDGILLSSPSFGIISPGQKFKLVSLQVGPHLKYDEELPETGWRKMDGLINIKQVHLTPTIFQDVVEFTSNLHLLKRDLGTVIGMMPRLKRLSVVVPQYPDGSALDSVQLGTLVQTKMQEVSKGHTFDYLSLASHGKGWLNHAGVYSSAKEFQYICTFSDTGSVYQPGGLLQPLASRSTPHFTHRVIVCVPRNPININPFGVAMELISQWGHHAVVELKPAYFKPSLALEAWMRHVLAIRLTMIKVRLDVSLERDAFRPLRCIDVQRHI